MMSGNWKTKQLGDICDIQLGKTPSRKNKQLWDEDKITQNVWLSVADLKNTDGKFVHDSKEYVSFEGKGFCKPVKQGTLLVSFKLTLGRLAIAGRELYTNEAIAALSINDEMMISREYLYYYLHYFDWDAAAVGKEKVKGKTLNKAILKTLEIRFPPLEEQEQIVCILDEVFQNIENRTSQAEHKLHNGKEMFQSVVANIFSQKDEGWNEKTLGEMCENLDRKRIPITKNKRVSGEIPYYGASGIVDYVKDYIFDEDLLLVSEDGANLLARTYPIAFSISGKTWVNNHAHVLRFENMVTQRFMEYYLNSIRLEPYVSGMAQPKLNQKSLNSIPVPEPPLNQQQTIVNKLDSLSQNVALLEENHRSEIESLVELKLSILQEAFSGKLTGGTTA